MERFDIILGKIGIERMMFIKQKGYEPNRMHINQKDFYVLADTKKTETFKVFGMDVVKSNILSDNCCIIFNVKDFPEIKIY